MGDEIEFEYDPDYDSLKVTCNASPPNALTIGRTVVKESDNLVILGVAFDSKITFKKHLCWVSRAASQRLDILTKSWCVFHDRSLLGKCFWGFVLLVLEYCSAVWYSAAGTHLKLLDHVVSGTSFLTEGEFECDLAHHRSVAVLCMLYKIRCKPMHLLYGALLMCLLAAGPPSTTGLLFPSQYLCGTILVTPYLMVWD